MSLRSGLRLPAAIPLLGLELDTEERVETLPRRQSELQHVRPPCRRADRYRARALASAQAGGETRK